MRRYLRFFADAARILAVGPPLYYAWMAALSAIVAWGVWGYSRQWSHGLSVTGMSDQVSWGIYIANFTFLVGVAAAAVMLVIPAILFRNRALHRIVFVGELMAVAAIVMCLLFVVVDMGRPDRLVHIFKRFNWPISMLSWDVIVLNGYLLLNIHISGYLLFRKYIRRPVQRWLYRPFVYVSIAWAISIHTVTAFLYCGLGGRPFWNSAVLAPRFLASAFTAGPAFIVLVLQWLRRRTRLTIDREAIGLLSRIMAVCMSINLFLLACEVFTEFYTDSAHAISARYLFFGLEGHRRLVPWIWTAILLDVTAWVLLLVRRWRSNPYTLELACVATIVGIWIEKGMGLIVPGFIPTPMGEVLEYRITLPEAAVSFGIWGVGALVYTILLRVAVPIEEGRLYYPEPEPVTAGSDAVTEATV